MTLWARVVLKKRRAWTLKINVWAERERSRPASTRGRKRGNSLLWLWDFLCFRTAPSASFFLSSFQDITAAASSLADVH